MSTQGAYISEYTPAAQHAKSIRRRMQGRKKCGVLHYKGEFQVYEFDTLEFRDRVRRGIPLVGVYLEGVSLSDLADDVAEFLGGGQ